VLAFLYVVYAGLRSLLSGKKFAIQMRAALAWLGLSNGKSWFS